MKQIFLVSIRFTFSDGNVVWRPVCSYKSYDHAVEKCNQLYKVVNRDGHLLYTICGIIEPINLF